jgi:hypothetical protein
VLIRQKKILKDGLKAGVCAVGMGSKLISKKLMEANDYATIENTTREVLAIIATIKNKYVAASHRKVQVDNMRIIILCNNRQLPGPGGYQPVEIYIIHRVQMGRW